MRFRLQRKETVAIPNILGGHSMPCYSYRWKDIATSDDKEALEKIMPNDGNHRIEDTRKNEEIEE